MFAKSTIFFLLISVVPIHTAGDPRGTEDVVVGAQSNEGVALTDKPLAAFQEELLEVAFETATAIPIKPHIKDRSRAQEAVVVACFKLDQPQRAIRHIEKIDNWRRGAGYADFAFYCAQHGHTEKVQHYLDLAGQISESVEDWRRDQIRVKIAQTYAWLGQAERVDQFEAGVEPSESGKVARVKAMRGDGDSFDHQVRSLDELIASGQFDVVKNALEACVQLFDRFYTDAERRTLVEEKIKTSWGILPLFIRIELLMGLAECAVGHEDLAKGLVLVNEAQLIMDSVQWPVEYQIPMKARVAGLRFRAGDQERARADLDAAFDHFKAESQTIVNIYRAGVLRPVAEAYQSMGDTAVALGVYRRAIEESVDNPNSRPRAEDLSATCLSMALHGVEPDAGLWARVRQIQQGLGEPW